MSSPSAFSLCAYETAFFFEVLYLFLFSPVLLHNPPCESFFSYTPPLTSKLHHHTSHLLCKLIFFPHTSSHSLITRPSKQAHKLQVQSQPVQLLLLQTLIISSMNKLIFLVPICICLITVIQSLSTWECLHTILKDRFNFLTNTKSTPTSFFPV